VEAGKRRLEGDIARAATTGEVQDLRREIRALKECCRSDARNRSGRFEKPLELAA
jgi:hypothetical protein